MENLPEPNESRYSHYYAFAALAAMIIGALFWLFTVNATAQHADAQSIENARQLEHKADRDATDQQLKRIFDKLDSIDSYLRDHK